MDRQIRRSAAICMINLPGLRFDPITSGDQRIFLQLHDVVLPCQSPALTHSFAPTKKTMQKVIVKCSGAGILVFLHKDLREKHDYRKKRILTTLISSQGAENESVTRLQRSCYQHTC